MMPSRLHIAFFLALSVCVWGATLYFAGVPLQWVHLKPFSLVVAVLAGVSTIFEKYFWSFWAFRPWLIKRPDLRGTWRVELQSDWIDKDTNERVPLIVCYMGVKQSLSKLQLHLMTPESESWLIADEIRKSQSGVGYQVVGVYSNRPKTHLRGDKSEIHLGALFLDTHGPEHFPEALEGEYWTDRKTKGSMHLSHRSSKILTRFADAADHFEKRGI